ncbi:predicted protein [Nematostella vectensis]|uniref:Formin GTPase-binding domain-containing protein n=1 Tax=Nematostella vectensis TaxID=45351 RepID=A7S8A3_NEMVE|nr:predicted protein [Nematostella vectensis]|eukprot:XP_001632091.1 predicted protein [Nematostella vectensis]
MVLRSLEIDLRTHPNTTWLREFIDDPYRGHMALVEFLQFLHLNPPSNDSSDDIGDTDKSKVSKKTGSQKSVKPDVLARSHIDEHLCLQSLRVLMKNKHLSFKDAKGKLHCVENMLKLLGFVAVFMSLLKLSI